MPLIKPKKKIIQRLVNLNNIEKRKAIGWKEIKKQGIDLVLMEKEIDA